MGMNVFIGTTRRTSNSCLGGLLDPSGGDAAKAQSTVLICPADDYFPKETLWAGKNFAAIFFKGRLIIIYSLNKKHVIRSPLTGLFISDFSASKTLGDSSLRSKINTISPNIIDNYTVLCYYK